MYNIVHAGFSGLQRKFNRLSPADWYRFYRDSAPNIAEFAIPQTDKAKSNASEIK